MQKSPIVDEFTRLQFHIRKFVKLILKKINNSHMLVLLKYKK